MRGYLINRYQRFLADIETTDGETITAYCPATGRMTTCLEEGAPVEFLRIDNPDRKLDYDWWSIKMPDSWVIIDTRPANRWLYWSRTAPWLPEDWAEAHWTSEPSLPDGGRLDYRLDFNEKPSSWIEIKSVTWCEDGTGYFPDAPTDRGRRHLETLREIATSERSAWLVLVSMRSDIEQIKPARDVDPDFATSLKAARDSGVHLLGIDASVQDRTLDFTGTVPVKL